MKAFCFSDIHGNTAVAQEISGAFPQDTALIIFCGDWTTFGEPSQVDTMLRIMKTTGTPLLSVSGNCDSPEIEKFLSRKGVTLDGKGRLIENIGFFGLSASNMTPFSTPFERTEEELLSLLHQGWSEIKEAERKVLVTHAPPFNTGIDLVGNNVHAGSSSVRKFLNENPVDLVLCGHIHESRGIDRLNNVLVANLGASAKGWYGIAEINTTVSVRLRNLHESC